MAKMPGIWRTRPKISEAELAEIAAERHRTEERLAAIFGLPFVSTEPDDLSDEMPADQGPLSVDTAEPEPAPEPEAPVARVERLRPGIMVAGTRDLVGVMDVVDDAPLSIAPDVPEAVVSTMTPPTMTPAPTTPAPAQVAASEPTNVRKPRPVGATAAPKTAKPAAPKAATVTKTAASAPKAAPVTKTAATAESSAAKAAPAKPAAGKPATPKAATPKAATARPAKSAKTKTGRAKAAPVPVASAASCPYCAVLLEPEPASSRRCAQCRQRIIVKRVDGRKVFLAEAVIPVFEAERRRVADGSRFAREAHRWLRLAVVAGAPPERVEQRALAAQARPSEDAVAASRALYLATVEHAYQDARRAHRWDEASRVRRDQAMALYRAAGVSEPPSEAILKLHREAVAAELRGIAEMVRDAELAAATCCDTCREDDHRIVRISAELRAPSLPHAGCPKGLCACHWDLPMSHRATVQRYARRRANADSRGARAKASPSA